MNQQSIIPITVPCTYVYSIVKDKDSIDSIVYFM